MKEERKDNKHGRGNGHLGARGGELEEVVSAPVSLQQE